MLGWRVPWQCLAPRLVGDGQPLRPAHGAPPEADQFDVREQPQGVALTDRSPGLRSNREAILPTARGRSSSLRIPAPHADAGKLRNTPTIGCGCRDLTPFATQR